MDLIEKQVLQLTQLKFAVLDEADQMLDMGFKDELEKIFAAMGKTVDRQLLLFSATLPPWVKKIAGEYCQNSSSLAEIDLVGGGKDGLNKIVQASTDVKHTCVPVSSAPVEKYDGRTDTRVRLPSPRTSAHSGRR